MSYSADGNQVFVTQVGHTGRELFLTVHRTDSSIALDDQARVIARMLNTRGTLAEGEHDAQKYFILRVDRYLAKDDAKKTQPLLWRFMAQWWPAFRDGIERVHER